MNKFWNMTPHVVKLKKGEEIVEFESEGVIRVETKIGEKRKTEIKKDGKGIEIEMYENIYGEPTGTPEGREVIYVKEEAKPQYWQMETVMTEKRREAVCVIEEGNLKKRYLSIEGDIVCVSSVAGASKELQEWAKRKNVWLVSPDTGKTAIRNRDGQIEAVRQFVLHVAAE